MRSLQNDLDLEPGERITHIANQSSGHLIPLVIAVLLPCALLAFVGFFIPWIWFWLVHFSHRGQCVVTTERVFILNCSSYNNWWWRHWHIANVDTGGWPFNTIHIHAQDGDKITIRHLGDHKRLARVIRSQIGISR